MFRSLLPLSVLLSCSAAQPDLKSNLVADHSRKTFRPDDNTISLLLDDVPMLDKGKVAEPLKNYATAFAQSARETLEHGQDEKIFKQFWYDPTYKVHDLCEPHRSGHQINNLIWTESGDKLLRVIGNGVVKDGYNMFIAPGQERGQRTDVYVALYVESMSSFKAQTMDFEVDMYLAMGWFDRRLAHNCTYPILVTNKLIADRIWHPDLYFVNSKFAYLQEVTTPNFMVIVYPDGLIFKSMRLDVTLSCMMDLKMFPMDYQECPITIQSYAYIEQIVNLTWHVDMPSFPIGSNPEIRLNDMDIVGSRVEKCAGPYPMFRGTADWSCIKAFIMMKRLVLFHIIQTYIPTGMLVSISWMSFWLDPRASPARVSLTITSLLTLTTMSNGARQDLPQVSYIKALDVWLTVSQALIFLVLLEYSFVSYFVTKREFHCAHRRGYKQHKLSAPNGGVHDEEKGKDEINEVFPFTRDSPTPSRKASEKKKNFSLSHGLTACMSHTATLCHSTLLAERIALTRDWLESECENSALMSATPHAAAQVYSKYDVTKPCQKCAYENEKRARRIDKYSRAVFPTVFSTFTVVYWLYYSWKSEELKMSK